MSTIQDKKIEIIYDNYKNNLSARNAQEEVEALRNRAYGLGAGISTLAFTLNEFSRMSLRSRKFAPFNIIALFKYKPLNLVFWLVAPTLLAK